MAHESDGHSDVAIDRRSFVGGLALVASGLVAALGTAVAGVFAVGPSLRAGREGTAPCSPVDAPSPDGPSLRTITVTSSSGWSETRVSQAIFVDVGADGAPRAFSARCPHEGCHVDWKGDQNLYVCPCHNSRWTRDGGRVSGPTKRGLDPLPVDRGPGGEIQVCYKTFALDTPERIEVG